MGVGGQEKTRLIFIRTCAVDLDDFSRSLSPSAKLKRTEAAIEEYRSQIDTRKAENYGFASLAAVPYAHIVAKKLDGKHPKGTTIDLAPNPKDIVRIELVTFLKRYCLQRIRSGET